MKISDIVVENQDRRREKTEKNREAKRELKMQHTGDPEMLNAAIAALAQPNITTAAAATSYAEKTLGRKAKQHDPKAKKDRDRPSDTKDTPKPKDPIARRVSKFDQFDKSGKSGLFKGVIDKVKDLPGVKQFAQGWELGADLAADLDVPKPKRK